MKRVFISFLFTLCASLSAAPQKQSLPDMAPLSEMTKAGAKVGVLLFVSRECPVSNSYAPEIERIYKSYASKGVQMRLIYEDTGAKRGDLNTHEAQYRLTLPVWLDDRQTLAKSLHATVTPEVFVFTSGTLAYRGRIDDKYADFGKVRPQATTHDLRDALDAVLVGKPVAHPVTKAVGCFL